MVQGEIHLILRDGYFHADFYLQGRRYRKATKYKTKDLALESAQKYYDKIKSKLKETKEEIFDLPIEKIPELKLVNRNGLYHAHFSLNSVRYRKATKTKDKRLALIRGQEFIEQTLLENKNIEDFRETTLNHLLKLFISRNKDKSESQFNNYLRFTKRITNYLGEDTLIKYLNRYKIEDLRNHLLKEKVKSSGWERTLSEKTVSEHLNFLASVFNYFEVSPNPCHKVKRPKKAQSVDMEERKFYTKVEMLDLMNSIRVDPQSPRIKQMKELFFSHFLDIIFGTGIRLGEAQGIRYRDVNLKDEKLKVTSDKTKTSRVLDITNNKRATVMVYWSVEEMIKLSAEYYQLQGLIPQDYDLDGKDTIDKLIKDFPDYKLYFMYDNFFYKALKNHCKLVGVEFKTVHALRHSFASFAISSGNFTIEQVAKILGHHDINLTFNLYSHFTPNKSLNYEFFEGVE